MFTNSDSGVHEVWLHLGDKYNTSNMCHFYKLFVIDRMLQSSSGGCLPGPGGSPWSGGFSLVWGGSPWSGGCLPGGVSAWGVSAWLGGVCLVGGGSLFYIITF